MQKKEKANETFLRKIPNWRTDNGAFIGRGSNNQTKKESLMVNYQIKFLDPHFCLQYSLFDTEKYVKKI